MTPEDPTNKRTIPSVSILTAQTGASTKANQMGMRVMQERAYACRGEQYLLIKSPPASGKSRALMFIALDKLRDQGIKQAIIVVPERSIGASFSDEPLTRGGFWADWTVKPQWNLCNAPGIDEPKVAKSKVKVIPKRRPGRPATGRDPIVVVRLAPVMIAAIDAWANKADLTRSEAIRRLIDEALSFKRKPAK